MQNVNTIARINAETKQITC